MGRGVGLLGTGARRSPGDRVGHILASEDRWPPQTRAGRNLFGLAAAERPQVSLAAAAVQARRGPARPEAAVEISRTSETARSFLNCESGVRVTPGAPISRVVNDHSSELRRSCGGRVLKLLRRAGPDRILPAVRSCRSLHCAPRHAGTRQASSSRNPRARIPRLAT